ncbi:MAG: 50S ribosomal protein L19 [Pseudanabaenaceae cyanobacterium]
MHAQAIIRAVEAKYMKKKVPQLFVGDRVKIGVKIIEGNKERTQPYEGDIIAIKGTGINTSITVRKTFQGVGVERVFLIHSPKVESIKVVQRGKVRRAKLYYLRNLTGKAARIKARFDRSDAQLEAKAEAKSKRKD